MIASALSISPGKRSRWRRYFGIQVCHAPVVERKSGEGVESFEIWPKQVRESSSKINAEDWRLD